MREIRSNIWDLWSANFFLISMFPGHTMHLIYFMLPSHMEWVLSVFASSSQISMIINMLALKQTAATFQYPDSTPPSRRSEPPGPLHPVRSLVLMKPSNAIAWCKCFEYSPFFPYWIYSVFAWELHSHGYFSPCANSQELTFL